MFKRIKRALLSLPLGFLTNILEDLILDAIEEKVRNSPGKMDDYIALPLIRLIRHLVNGVPLGEAIDRVFSDASDAERDVTDLVMSRLKTEMEASS